MVYILQTMLDKAGCEVYWATRTWLLQISSAIAKMLLLAEICSQLAVKRLAEGMEMISGSYRSKTGGTNHYSDHFSYLRSTYNLFPLVALKKLSERSRPHPKPDCAEPLHELRYGPSAGITFVPHGTMRANQNTSFFYSRNINSGWLHKLPCCWFKSDQ